VIVAPDPASPAPDFIVELDRVTVRFGTVTALHGVSLQLRRGEVHCLLGDNGAGKSTLIKILSGVHPPSEGSYRVDGEPVAFESPRDALDRGIATVYQDLALVPLLSVGRNFFLGREPTRRVLGVLRVFDRRRAARVARERLADMGIAVRDDDQPVGTMSGGERQCLAIARAIHFGARVLILDEPTAALGVKQSANTLRIIARARDQGIAVVFITHNAQHAYPIGDRFTLLDRGRSLGTFTKAEISHDQLVQLMAGGHDVPGRRAAPEPDPEPDPVPGPVPGRDPEPIPES
jgi:simple sugar transport system ATP-binding protein